jgi:adenosylcobinamide kinase/adenosylcobinamide-phosphate guanylyltransferase
MSKTADQVEDPDDTVSLTPPKPTPPRGRLILVIGGASSGKSDKALELAASETPKVFVATGQRLDEEMAARIRRHQSSRGSDWETAEVPVDLAQWFEKHRGRYRTIVLDCVTLWLSNIQCAGIPRDDVGPLVSALIAHMRRSEARVIVVTNELGMGLVPFDRDIRRFRELAGEVNRQLAEAAEEVYYSIAGLSIQLK